jgi:hypothetical protein
MSFALKNEVFEINGIYYFNINLNIFIKFMYLLIIIFSVLLNKISSK